MNESHNQIDFFTTETHSNVLNGDSHRKPVSKSINKVRHI